MRHCRLTECGQINPFNALTRTAAAQAANFPFCTIEPNVGEVSVPDARLDALAAIAVSKEIIPARLSFVDIAGLVRGASKGKASAISFLVISAKLTRLPMFCVVLKTQTSPMLREKLTRWRMPKLLKLN